MIVGIAAAARTIFSATASPIPLFRQAPLFANDQDDHDDPNDHNTPNQKKRVSLGSEMEHI